MTAAPLRTPPSIDNRRVVRGGAVMLLGSTVNRVVAFVLASILAHQLSVHEFGTYAFAMAAGGFFTMFADLGLDTVTTRELAAADELDDGRILASALVAKAAMVVVALVIGLAATLTYDESLRLASVVATVSVVAAIPSTIGLVLTARVRMVAPVVTQLVTSLLTLGASLLVLARGAGPVALVGVTVTGTFIAALALSVLGRRRLRGGLVIDHRLTVTLLRHTAPLAVAAIGALAYRRLDQLMLGNMVSAEDVARYSSAVRLVDGLNVVPAALAVVALPALSTLRAHESGRAERLVADGYRLLAATILPVAALGTVIGGSALALAFGEQYRSASDVLTVLLWAHFFGFAGVLLQQVLVVRHQTGLLAVLVLGGGALNVIANLWAIPRFGGIGAAWTSLLAYATPFGGGLLMPRLRDAYMTCLRASARPAAAAGGILAVLLVAPTSSAGTLGLFAVAAPIALVVTRSVTSVEVRQVLGHLRPRAVSPGRSA